MQLQEALKELAAAKQDDNDALPAFLDEDGEYGDFGDEEEEIVEVTEEELLRFLDEQLPPLVVRVS